MVTASFFGFRSTLPASTGSTPETLCQLNNDHGLSPDGTRLAISDKTRTGMSEIYTLPVSGGAPEPLGAPLPAYWHGWSPDGATLAYAGRRDGVFQICTMPAQGGAESILTQGFDHCDGPDYTPDGRWILVQRRD